MPFYKDTEGGLHFIDSADFQSVLPAGSVEISDAEANAMNAPTADQIAAQYEAKAQAALESLAKSWGYDSVISICSYSSSTVPQFKADADAFIEHRDSTWLAAQDVKVSVSKAGAPKPATAEAFLALLPAAPAKPVV